MDNTMTTQSKSKLSSKTHDTTFAFPETHGGRRAGAGRKRSKKRACVERTGRDQRVKGCPIMVTMKLQRGLPSLRSRAGFEATLRSIGGGNERFGFRVVHYSILSNHVHMVVEADDRSSLTLGMQGLCIRMAKALNRAWARKGKIFVDRYHDRVLRSPREVRSALAYVLKNAMRHGYKLGGRLLDLCSSGRVFDGWKESEARAEVGSDCLPVVAARTWLLRIGWRRRGLISALSVPGPAS